MEKFKLVAASFVVGILGSALLNYAYVFSHNLWFALRQGRLHCPHFLSDADCDGWTDFFWGSPMEFVLLMNAVTYCMAFLIPAVVLTLAAYVLLKRHSR